MARVVVLEVDRAVATLNLQCDLRDTGCCNPEGCVDADSAMCISACRAARWAANLYTYTYTHIKVAWAMRGAHLLSDPARLLRSPGIHLN